MSILLNIRIVKVKKEEKKSVPGVNRATHLVDPVPMYGGMRACLLCSHT